MSSVFKNLALKLLREAEDEKSVGEDSLDAQIDRFLVDYESEAKNVKTEGRDFRSLTRRFLSEAEGDEKKDSDKEKDEDSPKKLTADDIDVNAFVTDVMRLVDNYDTLLEVRNTLLRRATNFLSKSYEQDVVDSFNAALQDTYGVEVGKSAKDAEEEFQAPRAGAAGPAGGGA